MRIYLPHYLSKISFIESQYGAVFQTDIDIKQHFQENPNEIWDLKETAVEYDIDPSEAIILYDIGLI